MKFIVEINYADHSDSYDLYNFHTLIPYEAETLEIANTVVQEAINKNTGQPVEYDEDMEYPEPTYVFGHDFGFLNEGQTISFKIYLLEEWFNQNLKTIDFPIGS